MGIQLKTEGRRIYLVGDTYAIKDRIKSMGGHWDGESRAWWVGSGKLAEAQKLAGTSASASQGDTRRSSDAPGESAIIAGRCKFKGHAYYLAGRDTSTGRWDRSVEAITTRDGAKCLLYLRDGSKQFWAAREAIEITKSYSTPSTIRKIKEYAQEAAAVTAYGGTPGCSACRSLGRMCPRCEFHY